MLGLLGGGFRRPLQVGRSNAWAALLRKEDAQIMIGGGMIGSVLQDAEIKLLGRLEMPGAMLANCLL